MSDEKKPALTKEQQEEKDWKDAEVAKLDKTPYGVQLAKHVADEALAGHDFVAVHRDYCGLGIFSTNSRRYKDEKNPDQIYLSYANDGYPDDLQYRLMHFHKADDFIAWFAHQSDYTMCGASQEKDVAALHTKDVFSTNNQRVTKEMLLQHLEESKKEKKDLEAEKKRLEGEAAEKKGKH